MPDYTDGGGADAGVCWQPPESGSANMSEAAPTASPAVTTPASTGASAPTGLDAIGGGPGASPSPYAGMFEDGLKPPEPESPETQAAKAIGASYAAPDAAPHIVDDKVDISNPKAREATLNKMVQNDPDDPQSLVRCGPTAVLAGAIKAGGMAGVNAVLADIAKGADGKPDEAVRQIQAAAKKGNLTSEDLRVIESKMYDQMKRTATTDAGKQPGVGVDGHSVEDFISKDKNLAAMFKKSHEEIDMEDTTGNGSANHFVLGTRDAKNNLQEIYDPMLRKDGNQNISDQESLNNYDLARTYQITPVPPHA